MRRLSLIPSGNMVVIVGGGDLLMSSLQVEAVFCSADSFFINSSNYSFFSRTLPAGKLKFLIVALLGIDCLGAIISLNI